MNPSVSTPSIVLRAGLLALAMLAPLAVFAAQSPAASEKAARALRARYAATADGTVRDAKTRLEWTASDQAQLLTWREATQHCQDKGDAWHLPSVEELLSLRDPTGTLETACGTFRCRVSPLFQLSNVLLWTSSTQGPEDSFIVDMYEGETSAIYNGASHRFVSLCAQRVPLERETAPARPR